MEFSEIIEKSVKVISQGGIILYPTDTIWGIGGDATNPAVIERIYEIKKRSDSKSLVSLVADMTMLESISNVSPWAKFILTQSTKPTTVIYNSVRVIHHKARAEDGSAAIRIPENEFCKRLIAKLKKPLLSTSANISGEPSPNGFSSVSKEIKDMVDYIVPHEIEVNSEQTASRILKIDGKDVIVIRE